MRSGDTQNQFEFTCANSLLDILTNTLSAWPPSLVVEFIHWMQCLDQLQWLQEEGGNWPILKFDEISFFLNYMVHNMTYVLHLLESVDYCW